MASWGSSLALVSRWGLVRTMIQVWWLGTTAARTLDNAEVTEILVSSRSSFSVALDGEVA